MFCLVFASRRFIFTQMLVRTNFNSRPTELMDRQRCGQEKVTSPSAFIFKAVIRTRTSGSLSANRNVQILQQTFAYNLHQIIFFNFKKEP